MVDERELLAVRLKEFRENEKLNQFDFAEDCGISKETVSLIERAVANVRLDTVQLLACRMGVTVSELFQHKQISYIIVPGETTIEGKRYKTYGIGAVRNNMLIDQVPNISTDFNKIKSLVLVCNEESLSLTHLYDVVEDALI